MSSFAYSEEPLDITSSNLQGVWEFYPISTSQVNHNDIKTLLFSDIETLNSYKSNSTVKQNPASINTCFLEFIDDVIHLHLHQFNSSDETFVFYFQTLNPFTLLNNTIQTDEEKSLITADLKVIYLSEKRLDLYIKDSNSLLSFKRTTKDAIKTSH